MNWLRRLFRREPVTFSDGQTLRLSTQVKIQTEAEAVRLLDRPTYKRIDMNAWKLERARRRAKVAL
ncbi:MAG: hypothetical protein ACT4O5_08745 [Gammaproteobacteria bacterium]